jgi:hypothetical protein
MALVYSIARILGRSYILIFQLTQAKHAIGLNIVLSLCWPIWGSGYGLTLVNSNPSIIRSIVSERIKFCRDLDIQSEGCGVQGAKWPSQMLTPRLGSGI